MSAAEVLKELRAAGVEVAANGDNLSLRADQEPSPEVLEKLRQYKPAILRLLKTLESKWSIDEWHDYFAERAAISEFDHGLTRVDAEKNAFSHCVQELLRQNPISSAPGVCHQCLQPKGLIQPYFTGGDVHNPAHVWLHPNCAVRWHEARRDSAIASLEALGLRAINAVS
jgi:hypothetical protein